MNKAKQIEINNKTIPYRYYIRVIRPTINKLLSTAEKNEWDKKSTYTNALKDIKKLLSGKVYKREKYLDRKKRVFSEYLEKEARGEVDFNDPLRILISR